MTTGSGEQPIDRSVARARHLLPGAVETGISRRLALAHDASHYLLTPAAVVTATSRDDVARLLAAGAGPLTFRSGGTSLSGQAGTSAILVDVRRHFRRVDVLDDGLRVRAQPGATVRSVNARLARRGRKLGPDPASEAACTIGGVVADNSSGMACGTEQNTYRTLDSAVLALASGTVVDTGSPTADADLARSEPELHAGLARLRDELRSDPESVARIEAMFAIKNTMGYGLNAFLDHDDPVDILAHVVVGSEGTLAFVAEATFHTVPLLTHTATALLTFADLADATAALPALVAASCATIELLDATSLRVAQRDPRAPEQLRRLDVTDQAALLIEFQEADAAELTARCAAAARVLDSLPLLSPPDLTTEPIRRGDLWHIRKGLYASIAGSRPPGTTALLEDIAVPVERLRATCHGLHELFDRHGYADAVIFGHAKDGNVHFMITPDLADPDALASYSQFTDDLVDLVLAAGGTLKAEHGTGRTMAPFVRRQYGPTLHEAMVRLKHLADPRALLNPGVLLTDDPHAHLADLKWSPPVEVEVDRCVECGYCEPVCPSRDLTLTPRQRIVLRRELVRAEENGEVELADRLRSDFAYEGVDTCAVDGMCRTACPVGIDTGDLVRRLRAEQASALAGGLWSAAARNWDAVTRAGGLGLTAAGALPAALPRAATGLGRRMLGADTVPEWSGDLPRGGTRRRPRAEADPDLVFFPSCLGTLFAPEGGGDGSGAGGAAAAFLRLCELAGRRVRIPAGIGAMCCGTPWSSKGMTGGYERMRSRVREALWRATDAGRLPVVVDAASCTEGLLRGVGEEITVLDAVSYTRTDLLPAFATAGPGEALMGALERVVVHPTCASTALGVTADLVAVAGAAAREVIVPTDWGCCGFAGDRGMLHPELTAAATAPESAQVTQPAQSTQSAQAADRGPADAYVSLNRTCEIGMSRATGRPYRHVLEVLRDVLEAADPIGDQVRS
ncbi:FAD-binding and (Fe-S)-binding domain-containing protein [Pseudactinotalea sp. HY158]|uniref:FAD-binding and (Fe-S)-binding domain-containing protein n=1 Tax=Pseudactinotalea sp. HY158 TaxID=2654547 RepID=UPI00129C624D|nr:FAD-binding and (Fe-S)-binding domain-containing protein [Pseudactinotalea sp. HY158]QGH69433.1 FAD-binding protein [Pseudactinotalea sp. HY158]